MSFKHKRTYIKRNLLHKIQNPHYVNQSLHAASVKLVLCESDAASVILLPEHSLSSHNPMSQCYYSKVIPHLERSSVALHTFSPLSFNGQSLF